MKTLARNRTCFSENHPVFFCSNTLSGCDLIARIPEVHIIKRMADGKGAGRSCPQASGKKPGPHDTENILEKTRAMLFMFDRREETEFSS